MRGVVAKRAKCVQLPAIEEFLNKDEHEKGTVIQHPVNNPSYHRALEGAKVFMLVEDFSFHKLPFEFPAEKANVIPFQALVVDFPEAITVFFFRVYPKTVTVEAGNDSAAKRCGKGVGEGGRHDGEGFPLGKPVFQCKLVTLGDQGHLARDRRLRSHRVLLC